MKGAGTVLLFPNVLKPYESSFIFPYHDSLSTISAVARVLTKVPSHIKRATELLRPIIEDRMAKLDQYGSDWPDKPVRFNRLTFHFTHRLSLDVERYGDLAYRESQSAGEGTICPRFNIADSHHQLCCSPLNRKRGFLRNDIATILTNDTDINSRVVRSRELPAPHPSTPRGSRLRR